MSESPSDEPLHDELDQLGVPFRSTQRKLVDRFGGEVSGSYVTCSLPMASDFVPSQTGPLWFRAKTASGFDRPPRFLVAAASDFDAVVADLAARFGAAVIEDLDDPARGPATRATWKIGSRSSIRVTAEVLVVAGHVAGCELTLAPNVEVETPAGPSD